MPTGRFSTHSGTRFHGCGAGDRGVRTAASLAAALLAMLLAGCGQAPWEEARTETEQTARRVDAAPPPSVLFPRDDEEKARWKRLLAEGWAEGQKLADDIFAADLDRLLAGTSGTGGAQAAEGREP